MTKTHTDTAQKMVTLDLQLPENLFAVLKKGKGDVPAYLKQQAALEQYREGSLSFGQAAMLSGMSKEDFLHFLSKHGLSLFKYSEEDLKEEFTSL